MPIPCALLPDPYQLDFRTPGIIPSSDSSRKQMRQMPNLRRNARERPHRPQRLCWRTANFGVRLLFSIMAFRAISNSLDKILLDAILVMRGARTASPHAATTTGLSSPRKGMPSSRRSA